MHKPLWRHHFHETGASKQKTIRNYITDWKSKSSTGARIRWEQWRAWELRTGMTWGDHEILLLLSAFFHQGSPQRIVHLQLLLSSASSSVTSTSAMSSFTISINLIFGLPRFLFPGNSIISILLSIHPSSFLRTCPYHLSLASRVFSPNRPTCALPLMYSFMIVSILVTLNENRNIFNSATSISASCLFVSATVFNPYNIAGLTATLYTFPFTLAATRLSQITPDILLQPLHPACTLFFTSLPHSPLLCTVEPRYLKSSTFATSSPCLFTVPLTCLSFTHMYSVFLLLTFIPLDDEMSPPYRLSSHSGIYFQCVD